MRRETEEQPRGGENCCWQQQGVRCMWRGIISTTTSGGGQWYCREHWARAQGQEPGCIGNELPRKSRMRQTGPKRAPSPLRAMLDAGGPRQFAQLAGRSPEPVADDAEVPF